MNRKMLILMVMLTMVLGLATSQRTAAQAVMEQKGTSVILESFASKEIRQGDTWKVYLKASEPEGKMRYIFATVFQPGIGTYPVSIIRIKEENQKEFSGYISLKTPPVPLTYFFNLSLNLTVSIRDKAGRFSEPIVFPLFFQAEATQSEPPEGVFQAQYLGPVMVTLRNVEPR